MIPHDSPPSFQRYETFTARHFPKPTAFHSYLSLLERIHSSPNCPIITIQIVQVIFKRSCSLWYPHSFLLTFPQFLMFLKAAKPSPNPGNPGRPGHWRRGQEGELDETRLVDALAGEANVFRCGLGAMILRFQVPRWNIQKVCVYIIIYNHNQSYKYKYIYILLYIIIYNYIQLYNIIYIIYIYIIYILYIIYMCVYCTCIYIHRYESIYVYTLNSWKS
jgi:hypothetical protein